jgi:hypothetical protein
MQTLACSGYVHSYHSGNLQCSITNTLVVYRENVPRGTFFGAALLGRIRKVGGRTRDFRQMRGEMVLRCEESAWVHSGFSILNLQREANRRK